MRKIWLIFALAIAAMFGGSHSQGREREMLLKLPLAPAAEGIHSLPLTSMLSNLGSRVRGGYVLFGVEVQLKGGTEPTVAMPTEPPGDLGTALQDVLRQLPGYEARVVSAHLINVSPGGTKSGQGGLLNMRIARFSVRDVAAASILGHPERFIPELRVRMETVRAKAARQPELYSGPYAASSSPVTLDLKDVTLREVLNHVSQATEYSAAGEPPLGWAYKVNADDTPGVPKHTWQSQSGLPTDWRIHRNSRMSGE